MQIVLIAAQSLDGFITRHAQPGSAFTSAADKAWFHTALAAFDCCVMGRQAYESARPQFQTGPASRQFLRLVLTRQPARFAAETVPDALEFSAETPAQIAAALAARGRRRCALLGGAQIHSLFLDAGLVDECWLTLEPRLFGAGTPLIAHAADQALTLLSAENLGGGALLLKYAPRR